MKEFWKSVKIWRSCRHEFGGLLFWNTVYRSNTKMTPTRTSLRGNIEIDPPVHAQREPKNKLIKRLLRNQNMWQTTCAPKPPTLSQNNWICMCDYTRDLYTYIFSGVSVLQGCRKLAISTTLATDFYNCMHKVQYYHTSCNKRCHVTHWPSSCPFEIISQLVFATVNLQRKFEMSIVSLVPKNECHDFKRVM